METRAFGNSGLTVSVLGFGAGHIGDAAMGEAEVERLLHGVLDLGVTLIDTARGYGLSEERIGRFLGSRRRDVVLSTKGGYGVDGVADWTAEVITRGIEDALGRLRTDVIDVFHLHSCPRDVLERGDVVLALDRARRAGKIRVAAYSGENEALAWAVGSDVFGSVQCSVNPFDQRALDASIPRAAARGMGVIAKRPIANAAWRFTSRPVGDYAEAYWGRLQAMRPRLPEIADWHDVALRWSAFAPGVSSVIAGTRSLEHLRANAATIAKGALDDATVNAVRAAFRACDEGWDGQV